MYQLFTITQNTNHYTVTDLRKEVEECVELLAELGYPEMRKNIYEIVFSNRMTSCMGRTHWSPRRPNSYKLIFNKKYVEHDPAKNVHNTIMHEVIHTVPGCMNHGWKWKDVANKVNRAYNFTPIERTGENLYYEDYLKERAKYKITCKGCGKEWYRLRKDKVVQACMINKATCQLCQNKSFGVAYIKGDFEKEK